MPGQSGQPVRLDSILGPDGCDCDERGSVGGAPIGSGCQPALSDLGRGSCDASVLIVVIRGPSGSGQTSMLRTHRDRPAAAHPLRALCTSALLAGTNLGHEWQSDGRLGDGGLHRPEPVRSRQRTAHRRATAALVVGVGKHWRPQSPRRCALAQPVRVPARRSTDRRFAWPNV